MSDKIKPHHLERKAILYIRQSSAYQVSQQPGKSKLQYAMQERLQQLGWCEIEVVDEDLGRSAVGTVTRAGVPGELFFRPPVTLLHWVENCLMEFLRCTVSIRQRQFNFGRFCGPLKYADLVAQSQVSSPRQHANGRSRQSFEECRERNGHRRELCRKTNSHALKHFEIFERHRKIED